MNNTIKFSRQLRIVGLCMANNSGRKYDSFDLAEMLKVENITIQRDLRELRQRGVPMVQSRRGGITVEESFNIDLFREFLVKLIGIVYTSSVIDMSFPVDNALTNRSFYKNFMQVIIGIEQKKRIHIKDLSSEEEFEISPLKLFQKDSRWHLLASSTKYGLKHYLLENLTNVEITEYSAAEFPDEKIEGYIRNAVFSNFKKGNIKIKFQFAKPNLDGYFPVKLCNYKLTKCNEANNIILETEVYSLDEVVNWLIENTPEVKIIEPPELIGKMKDKINMLIEMTKERSEELEYYDVPKVSRKKLLLKDEFYNKSISFIFKAIRFYDNSFIERDFTVTAEIFV